MCGAQTLESFEHFSQHFQGIFNRCYRGCESVQINTGSRTFIGVVGAGRVNSVLPVEGSVFIWG